MNTKPVQQVLPPAPPHMVGNGFRVHNFFPSGYNFDKKRMSPFFLLDYNAKIDFAPSETPRGVGVHPHRGFETVTIAYHGSVAHHDSQGGKGIIGEGEVQWMTAGSGLIHKEYHEQEYSRRGGLFQMVQLWVNLPAKDKMTPPKYQAITHAEMGKYEIPENGGTLEIIAGSYQGIKGPAFTFTPIEMYNTRLKMGAAVSIDLPAYYNTGIMVVEGSITINGSDTAPADHFVLFRNEGESIRVSASEDSIFLLISGALIDEPLEAYGPFLMNTHEELEQAVSDYNRGKFGTLED